MCWNEIEYLKHSLEFAYKHYDYVVIAEGCHMPNVEPRSTDGTVEYLDSLGGYYIKCHNKKNIRYDYYQCQILNEATNMLLEEGMDWIRYHDLDMFLFDKDMEKAKDKMEETVSDCITFNERRFFANFKYNALSSTGYFYRAIPDIYLTPISVVHAPDGTIQRHNPEHLDITCFHMCCAKKIARSKARYEMSAAKGTPNAMENFERFKNVDIKNPDPKEVEYLIGGTDFNVYEGELPEALRDHPWKDVEDIRWIND